MKFSTRTTYSLRALMELARADQQQPMLLREIACRQHLPLTYLEQLMVPLRKGGIVKATRGIGGGYLLARPPADITLAEVIELLEGPFAFEGCGKTTRCPATHDDCPLQRVLTSACHVLHDHFASFTLASLQSMTGQDCA